MANVRVVMVPGWEAKILRAADPRVRMYALRLEAGIIGNLAAGGHIVTGQTIGSVRSSRVGMAHYRVWIGGAWVYLEYGTRPHTIRPRGTGYMLRFIQNGQVRYAWSVRHPGNREYAVVRRAFHSL